MLGDPILKSELGKTKNNLSAFQAYFERLHNPNELEIRSNLTKALKKPLQGAMNLLILTAPLESEKTTEKTFEYCLKIHFHFEFHLNSS